MDSSGFPVADGTYSIIISLYNTASAGTTLWTASGTTAVPIAMQVSVQNGLFTVLLGDTSLAGGSQNSLDSVNWNSDSIFLGINVNGDGEMAPRRRFAAAAQAFNARQLQGMYASGTAFGSTSLFIVNQTSATAATGTRTALEVRSSGTGEQDYLFQAVNDLSNTVFSINRMGGVTTTNVTSTNLYVSGTASTSQLYVSGQLVCLATGTNCQSSGGAQTLSDVTALGSFSTTTLQFYGGFLASSSTVTSTLTVLGGATLQNATATNVTTTNLYVSGTASTSQLYVGGQLVCLATGTNCQAGTSSATDLNWTFDGTVDAVRNATPTTDIILGSTATSTGAPVYFDLNGGTEGTSTVYFGFATNTNVVIGGTSTTQTGLNDLFVMDGNDLFVGGSIGSASSVYTNGAFVAGPGSTYYGNGFITKNDGVLSISSSAETTITSNARQIASFADIGVTIQPYRDASGNAGAPVNILGGIGKNNQPSGSVFVKGSSATGIGDGGNLHLFGGNNESGSGGNVYVSAGSSTVAGSPGSIFLAPGNGPGQTGHVIIRSLNNDASQLRFLIPGGTDNNYIALKAPSVPAAQAIFTLPWEDGASSTVIGTNGTGQLSFVSVCLADGTNCTLETLATVSARGSFTTTTLQLYGGFVGASSTVTSTFTVLGGTSLQYATATNVTTTNLYVSGTASTSQLYVNGQTVCLANGTNCPASSAAQTLAQVTAFGSSATTTLQLYGGFLTASSTVTSTLRVLGTAAFSSRVDAPYLNRWFQIPLMKNTVYTIGAATTTAGTTPYGAIFDGSYMWIINNGSSNVSKIDVTTNRVVATTTVGTNPIAGAFDGNHLWVTNTGTDNSVSKIDVKTNAVVATTTVGSNMQAIAFDGTSIWVANADLDSVSKINITTNTVVATTSVGGFPDALAFDGNYLWVANNTPGNVSKIDILTNAVVATTTVGSGPVALAFDGNYLWAANNTSNDVSKIDVVTNAVVATTLVGTTPQSVIFDGKNILVASAGSANNVSKIDVTTNAVIATIPTGSGPNGMASDGTYVWVPNLTSENITKIPIGGGSGSNMNLHVNLVPDTNNSFDIGSGLLSFKDVYASGTANLKNVLVNAATGTTNYSMVIGYASSASVGGLCIDDTTTDQTCPTAVGASIMSDGTISSNAFDLAEMYDVNGSAEAGDLLVLDSALSSTVKRSEGVPYDSHLIGIVSANPGFQLGWSGGTKVALTGRVPTKVSAVNGSIVIGDPLTSSNIPGYAMKATKPGMIVGYALEDTDTTSTIEVFVSVGYSAGSVLTTDGTLSLINDDVVMTPRGTASSTTPTMDSWGLTFRGSAWDASSTTAVNRDFILGTDVISVTSSLFTFKNASGTALLSLDQGGNTVVNGDLQVGGRLFPSSKGAKQDQYYIFLDNQAPTGTYMATNADGWQSLDTYDFAERFYSPDELEAGDLVVVKNTGQHHVQRAWDEAQMLVGIVSTRPAFIAGRPATNTYPIALAGRVPTKVSTLGGDIKAGDPLAPSTIPGVAVKATKTGPIVGLALADYSGQAIGKIEVNVNPGWWTAPEAASSPLQTTTYNLQPLIRRGLAKIDAGVKKVHVTFETIDAYPFVQVTPRGLLVGAWGTENYSDTGFDIVMSEAQSFDAYFSWQVEPLQTGDRLYQSDGTYLDLNQMTGQPFGAPAATSTPPAPEPVPPIETATSTDASVTSTTP